MMALRSPLTFFLILCQFWSFGQNEKLENYVNWISNPLNGLRVNTTVGHTSYTVQAEPAEYLAYLYWKEDAVPFDSALTDRKNENVLSFNLRLESISGNQLLYENINDIKEYYERLDYLSFSFQKNISLMIQGEYFPCSYYHMERTYQAPPYLSIAFGIEMSLKEDQDMTIAINDDIWEDQIVVLTIKAQDLKNARQVLALEH